MAIRTQYTQQGFGLIELMVSVGIMVLVTSVVLVRQSTFNSAVLLENQAYEIAFDVRQTQLRAVSAQGGVDADFRTQYGVTFIPGDKNYYFFRGDPTNNSFFGAPGVLDSRFSVMAVHKTDGSELSNGVHIAFKRPEYDALFFDSNGNAIDEDLISIYICADIDESKTTEKVSEMAAGTRPADLRYDMDNNGSVTSADALKVGELQPNDGCNFRRIKVTNTGQITVN